MQSEKKARFDQLLNLLSQVLKEIFESLESLGPESKPSSKTKVRKKRESSGKSGLRTPRW